MVRAIFVSALAILVIFVVSGQENERCGILGRRCREGQCCAGTGMFERCRSIRRENDFCIEGISCPCPPGLECRSRRNNQRYNPFRIGRCLAPTSSTTSTEAFSTDSSSKVTSEISSTSENLSSSEFSSTTEITSSSEFSSSTEIPSSSETDSSTT